MGAAQLLTGRTTGPEECHPPPSDNTAHLEVRKRDIGDRFEEDSLIGFRDEVLAIVEAQGPIAFEESSRRYHEMPCSPGGGSHVFSLP